MKGNETLTALLSALSAGALATLGFAEPPEDILANAGKFKPTVTLSDSYGEAILTIPAPPPEPGEPREPATHEQIPKPQKIAAKIVANIEGFDFSEIGDDMPLSVIIGAFSAEDLTLGGSDEAARTGTFPSNGKKATFSYYGTFEKPNGDLYEKKVGSLIFAWTATRLTVTLAVADTEAAGAGYIGANDFIGLYEDVSPNGNRPGGSAKFADFRTDVGVSFGSLYGGRAAYLKGVSTTKYQKYGSDAAGTLEEFFLQSVQLTGAADTTAPKVSGTVPTKDVDDGLISFKLLVTDTPQPSENTGIAPPFVEIAITTAAGDEDFFPVDPSFIPEFAGKLEYEVVDLPLFEGKNTLTITVTDESGNATVLTKSVTFNP